MSSTSHFLSTLGGKDSFGTGSNIFAAIFAATTLTLHVVQSYLFTPVVTVKHISLPFPAPPPSPAPATTTRPLTPTRSSDLVDSRADIPYILISLALVLIVILAAAGSTFRRAKSKSTITPLPSSQEQDPPPKLPPRKDQESSDDAQDREDSSDEEREDGAGDPEDIPEDEGNDDQNGDNTARVSDGSPGDDPDDPSGSSNVDDIPPKQFKPDPWDVLALILLYIFAVTHIIRRVPEKYFLLKTVANRLFISAISIVPPVLHKYFVLKAVAKHLSTSARRALQKRFVLNTDAKRLFTSVIRTRASEFVEHALHHVDARSFLIENVGMSMAMDIVDVGFSNGTREIENAIVSVASKVIMADDLREVNTKPTLIEGLLVPISPELFRRPSSIPLQVLELPEPLVHPPPLPLPTLEAMELPSLPLPTLEAMIPPVEPFLPLPTLEAMIPPTEPFVVQYETSSAETESELLKVVRTVSGWGTVALIVRRVVKEWRRRRRGTAQIEQHEPKVEVETEDEDEAEEEEEEEYEGEDYSSTAIGEHSSNDVTDAHGIEEDNEDDIETHQYSDILEYSFVTAEEINVTIDIDEPIQEEADPLLPTITVSPSFDIPCTPERAVTYPSGTPSFVGVLTSSTLRYTRGEGTESRPATSPAITILTTPPTTPEPATVYPSGTPSFADVLTSSVLRPTRPQDAAESELSPGPFFTHFTFPNPGPGTNAPSFADTTGPVTFPFGYHQRQDNSNTDDAFMISSLTSGSNLRTLSPHRVSLSLGPALHRKRRRLDEADKITIRIATPSFDGVTTSSPAVDHNRRWLVDEIGTPTRNTRIRPSASTPRSVPSLSEDRGGNTTLEELELELESESEPITDNEYVFDTSPSFSGVLFSPAVQRRQRRHVEEETEETSLVDGDLFPHFVPGPIDVIRDEEVSVEQVQVYEDIGEKSMEIDDEDHSAIYGPESEPPFDLMPRPTPASTSVGKNLTSEDDQTILTPKPTPAFTSVGKSLTSEGDKAVPDQLTPKPTPRSADSSFSSEGNETVFDPEVIARGAAEMLRLMQEEMEREKIAKEEAAREENRAGKMKVREKRESSKVRKEAIDGTRRKYIGPLETLKQDVVEERHWQGTGGFMQDEAGSSSPSKPETREVDWQFSREKMVQEVARMRALVMTAYASEDYDDDEIDRLTLLHLGVGNMESDG